MQKFIFDPSWDRALSESDRQDILTLFGNTKTSTDMFPLLWTAVNYKGELLITVMIHNFSDNPIDFANTVLQYKVNDEVLAQHRFDLPNVKLDSTESTVWTFIFPVDSLKKEATTKIGKLPFA